MVMHPRSFDYPHHFLTSPKFKIQISIDLEFLNHQPLNVILQRLNLRIQIAGFVGGNASRNDSTADTACTAQGHFAGHVHVRYVLILSEER